MVRLREGKAKLGTAGRGVASVGIDNVEVRPYTRFMIFSTSNCIRELAKPGIQKEASLALVITRETGPTG